MCERYAWIPGARFNIARGQTAPVELARGPAALRWGLLPRWTGHGGKRPPMIYVATVEQIAATPLLRDARAKQRCLVRASGYYAWRASGGKRQPYWIHGATDTYFAGLAATNADDGVASFALVVVPARPVPPLADPIGPTMPAVVDARWLASPELVPVPLEGWRADAVSTHVNDASHDDAACIAPLGNPRQGELF